MTAFSAESEREALQGMFAGLDRVALIPSDLSDFAARIATLDVLVGLDSVSIHMAHRQGVASIMINAGSAPGLWDVPTGRVLADSGGCHHYPCGNVAPCRGTAYQNACVEAITPAQVFAAIEAVRHRSAGDLPDPALLD